MLRLFKYLIKTIAMLIRVYRWLQRLKRKIVSWFGGNKHQSQTSGKTTILHQASTQPTKKVFGSDEGSYVDYEELK